MMTARSGSTEYVVRINQDLSDNWAIELSPKTASEGPFKPAHAPLVIKVRADNREAALRTGLELLKQSNRIDSWEL